MGVSPGCIASVKAASGGRLTDDEAASLIERMEAQAKAISATRAGPMLELLVREHAAAMAQQQQIAAAIARRQAALNAIALDRSLKHVEALRAQGLSWRKAVLAFFEGTVRPVEGGRQSVAAAYWGYQSRYLGRLHHRLAREAPEAEKMLRQVEFQDDVVREMAELRQGGKPGATGNDLARRTAAILADAAELARRDLNRLGAPIGRLDGWTPHAHDSARVMKVTPEEWIGRILPRLDLDRSFPGATPAEAQALLRSIYDTIVTGIEPTAGARELTGRTGPANLANRLAASRVLHFKGADDWLAYRAEFGTGHVFDAIVGHLERAARSAAQIEKLGPNPEATLERMRAILARRARSDSSLSPAQRAEQARSLSSGSSIGSAFAEIAGLTLAPGNVRAAEIVGGVRGVVRAAKLAGAVISNISDTIARASAMTYQGQSWLGGFRDALGDLMRGRPKGDQREIAFMVNAGVEGMRDHIVAPMVAQDVLPGAVHQVSQWTFRWQGMTWWNDVNKAGAARAAMRWMGHQRDLAHGQLSEKYRRILKVHGIGPDEWDLYRAAAWQADDGNWYVTPDRLATAGPALDRLAAPEIQALREGLLERVKARDARTALEAEWVSRRVDRLQRDMHTSRESLQRVSGIAGEAADRQRSALRDRMAEIDQQLSELGEFLQAVKDRRTFHAVEPAEPAPETPSWQPGEPWPDDVRQALDLMAERRRALATQLGVTEAEASTGLINTPERNQMRADKANEMAARQLAKAGGSIAMDKQAFIVLGPPAAGKSSQIVNKLAERHKARIIDADDYKELLPEFENGTGAGLVHAESSDMATIATKAAVARGENIALPLVGLNTAKIAALVDELKAAGYVVHLAENQLPIAKAVARGIDRFRETGRLVDPDYILSVADRPTRTYDAVKEKVDSYARYSNDVVRGQPVRLLEASADEVVDGRPRRRFPDGVPVEGQGAAASSGTAAGQAQGVAAPGTSRITRAFDESAGVGRQAARMEGRLRERLDVLRRHIAGVTRDANALDRKRHAAWIERWKAREDDLVKFIDQVDERAAQRAALTEKELGAEAERVDAIYADVARRADLKLRGMIADEQRFAVVEADPATRRILLQGTRPGTVTGEAFRFFADLKGFPAAFAQRQLGRAIFGYGDEAPAERLLHSGAHLGALLVGMTALGYLAMSTKDLVRGYGPRDPDKPKTWLAALAQGGGAGIYGDFLFGEANRFGNRFLENAVGPVPATAASLANLIMRARDGEAKAGEAFNLALQNTPLVNLWFARPLLDFLFLNEIREALNPGGIARQDAKRRKDYGQERVLPTMAF